jgi:hypothetical protein
VEKVVYVALRPDGGPTPEAASILSGVRAAFADKRFRGISVQLPRRDVEDERDRVRGVVLSHIASDSGAQDARRLVAMICLWMDCADDTGEVGNFLGQFSDDVRGYTVTEAVCRWCPGPNGPVVEGVNAVTLMRRNPDMTRDQFLTHWAQVHMPISLRYHPQWRYLRNVVDRTLAGDPASAPDAIAEEGFRTPGDLIDPMRFYGVADGTAETLAANKATVFEDVPLFLDVASTMTFVTEEHVIRSAWTPYAVSTDRKPATATS